MKIKIFYDRNNKIMALCHVLLLVFLFSCKKHYNESINHNELKATIRLSTGSEIFINATGSYAIMDCQNGFKIDNNNQYPAPGLALDIHDASGNCITSTGTYYIPNFDCSVGTGGTVPILYNNQVVFNQPAASHNPGSITFTSFSNSDVQCYFSCTCMHGANDSVIINGTFIGNHMGY